MIPQDGSWRDQLGTVIFLTVTFGVLWVIPGTALRYFWKHRHSSETPGGSV